MSSRLSRSLVLLNNVGVGAGPTTVAVVSTGSVSQEFDSQPIYLSWWVSYGSGATGPSVKYQIVRGVGTAGTQVTGFVTIAEANAAGTMRGGVAVDTPPGSNALAYSLVFLIANASSAFTLTEVSLCAMVL